MASDALEWAVPSEVISDRTVLITGATAGIGLATAHALALSGAQVVIAGRSPGRTRVAVDAVRRASGNERVHPLVVDLACLASVRDGAEAFRSLELPLHVLVANAGVAGLRGATADGWELAFGTNHLGHFLLTMLLLPQLRASAPSRVVVVSSDSHFQARRIDWNSLDRPTRSFTGLAEYAVSKLCNVLFAQELARREAGTGVTACSLHPGVVASDIWKRVPRLVRPIALRFMVSPELGARTSVHCATEPAVAAHSGAYYRNAAVAEPSSAATPALAGELWEHSEVWVAE